MNQQVAKLLRKGAKKFKLPYKELKRAFKQLDKKGREKFLQDARGIDYV